MDKKATEICSAATNANQHGEDIRESTMNKERVSIAVKCLPLINTKKAKAVVAIVQGTIEDTYCVTVPEGNCFSLSTGLIVSNCMDALRYATLTDEVGTSKAFTKPKSRTSFNGFDANRGFSGY